MRPEDFDVQKVIDHLQGTCTETLTNTIEMFYPDMKEDDLTEEDHNDIDNQIFNCENCGWWCEAHEQSENGYCEDCSEVEEDGYCPNCGRWLEDEIEEGEGCEECENHNPA